MHDTVSFAKWMSTPFKEDYSEIRIRIGAGNILIRPEGIVITGEGFPMWCFVPKVVKDINTTLKEMREYIKPYLGFTVGNIYPAAELHIIAVEDDVEMLIPATGDVDGILADHRSGLFTAVPVALVVA